MVEADMALFADYRYWFRHAVPVIGRKGKRKPLKNNPRPLFFVIGGRMFGHADGTKRR